MSADSPAKPEPEAESFPAYEGRMNYIEGYTPVSLGAPHSSLERSSTWIGMGVVLISLIGVGIFLFGLATDIWIPSENNSTLYMIAGPIFAVILAVVGFGLIARGRRHYKKYRRETGRDH